MESAALTPIPFPEHRLCSTKTWRLLKFYLIMESTSGNSQETPRLRMAPKESSDELAHRCEREQRAVDLQRESGLEQSLAPYRVGSVKYLNAVPLTRGLEEEVIYA